MKLSLGSRTNYKPDGSGGRFASVEKRAVSGITFNIQGFSTDDGPGIRTTVFMKGCPLRCVWCHNPEGLRLQPELMWYDVRCIAAQDCITACSPGALQLTPHGIQIDRRKCNVCGDCAQACPSAALEVIGRSWTAEELVGELLKDQIFYETSGGGVTFSGGEPMLQTGFLLQVLPLCKEHGLHVALDTCGGVPWEHYQQVLPWVDMVLLDLKLIDVRRHKQATGVENQGILANAHRIGEMGLPVWVRTPVIPGYTQDLENVLAIAGFIRQNLPTIERWDLLAYTNLGRPKYHRLDRPYMLESTPLLTRQEMELIWEAAVKVVSSARWSGATRN